VVTEEQLVAGNRQLAEGKSAIGEFLLWLRF
jgi:hypothetical protein